jgi:putative hemolysin
MDFLLIAVLTVFNGLFAMSEMAVATSRKARLEAMAEAGDKGARVALELQAHPTRFLSTVQVGITSTGILNGIVGEAAFSASVAAILQGWGMGEKGAAVTATALVVTLITFVTIVFGELVPKRIGQMYPESVARWMAPPMHWLARMASPFVRMLTSVTQFLLRLMQLDRKQGPVVTEEEIAASLAEGLHAGLIEAHEHQMVRNVFHLDERGLRSFMTPRDDIQYFNSGTSLRACLEQLGFQVRCGGRGSRPGHSWYPVCRKDLDDVVGVVHINQLLAPLTHLNDMFGSAALDSDVAEFVVPATFVPETLSGLELLEQFRSHATRMVFVVDEYGVVQGILTPSDMLEGIAGELKPSHNEQAWATVEADGSWTLGGGMPAHELKARLKIETLPHEGKDRYNTLAGLIQSATGHLPVLGESVSVSGWIFEVIELTGRRIEKVKAKPE